MKVKVYSSGDFGGVSYKQGDFHTEGFSGMSYTTGDFVTNGTSGLGASVATDLLTNLLTPDIKSTIKDTAKATAKEAVSYILEEYKAPIVIGGVLAFLFIALEVAADVKILTKKG